VIRRLTLIVFCGCVAAGCGDPYKPTVRQERLDLPSKAEVAKRPAAKEAEPSKTETKEATLDGSAQQTKTDKNKPDENDKEKKAQPQKKRLSFQELAQRAAHGKKIKIPLKPPSSKGPVKIESREVELGSMSLTAPDSWTRLKPPIEIVAADFILPRAEGDPIDARLTISVFGKNNQESINQLREHLAKNPKHDSMEELEISGVKVTLVTLSATLKKKNQKGPFAPPLAGGRFRSFIAIVPIGENIYVVNCTGPEKTMNERSDEFRAFLKSLKPKPIQPSQAKSKPTSKANVEAKKGD